MDEVAKRHMVDCQKTFDRADHEQIILSSCRLGVSSVLLNLFPDYLRDRHQETLVNGTYWDSQPVTSGISQGSILGPLPFLCLVDSVATCTFSKTAFRIFFDDVAMYRVIQKPENATEFEQDLDAVFSWSSDVKLASNLAKLVFVRFSTEQKVPASPEYRLGPVFIPRSDTVEYLGLLQDHKLCWKDHISNLTTKAKKKVRYISFLFNRTCQRARIIPHKILVLPLFDHCGAVYNPLHKGLTDRLEDCSRAFLRSSNLGPAPEDTSTGRYILRLHQLGIEPLVLRRM